MKSLRLLNFILLPSSFFLLFACASILSGNDPVVVNAERTTQLAYDTFDTLFTIERANADLIKANAPEVHAAVDNLRRQAPQWLATARTMTKAYKTNRSAENKANLGTALAVLRAGELEALKYSSTVAKTAASP